MYSQGRINAARPVAGFLLLAHIVGLLWFAKLPSLSLAYAALIVAALGVFCFLPRNLLRRVCGQVAGLAAAAMCATFAVAYKDITLINGADYGALVLRAVVVGTLIIMLGEAIAKHAKPDEDV